MYKWRSGILETGFRGGKSLHVYQIQDFLTLDGFINWQLWLTDKIKVYKYKIKDRDFKHHYQYLFNKKRNWKSNLKTSCHTSVLIVWPNKSRFQVSLILLINGKGSYWLLMFTVNRHAKVCCNHAYTKYIDKTLFKTNSFQNYFYHIIIYAR